MREALPWLMVLLVLLLGLWAYGRSGQASP